MKVSVIVITKNEEENIRECLESVKWADEIIICDSDSTDRTRKIAEEFTNKIHVDNFTYAELAEKRRVSLNYAVNDWVLFLDADEIITKELAGEILNLKENNEIDGYYINRRNYYFGKWIKYCHQYPDYILRLFRRDKAQVTQRLVHEGIKIEGNKEHLNYDMIHYSYKDLTDITYKSNIYSTLQAQEFHLQNKKVYKFMVPLKALASILRIFISRKGYKDGIHGYFVSFTNSFITFLTYIKLLKLQNKL